MGSTHDTGGRSRGRSSRLVVGTILTSGASFSLLLLLALGSKIESVRGDDGLSSSSSSSSSTQGGLKKPLFTERHGSSYGERPDDVDVDFDLGGSAATENGDTSSSAEGDRISILNMTCGFFEQPLNHFDLPRGKSGTFQQRYCVYDEFMEEGGGGGDGDGDGDSDDSSGVAPVFFYTGNESPLEEYINNTGLMWELAPEFGARVVFVEHRYEGRSLPSPSIPNCMSYSSSIQALADYANFIELDLFLAGPGNGTTAATAGGIVRRRPVIAFGGSYGGMLSAWMRMKYPGIVTGAIAGSAPIWGFPRNFPDRIDAAWRIVRRGLDLNYPPTSSTKKKDEDDDTDTDHEHDHEHDDAENHCATNLQASWPLIAVLGESERGRDHLSKIFRLCRPLNDGQEAEFLLYWAQSPWFDLAEGSFPYPSSYITYALTHREVKLPAWPLQAACWKASQLHADFNVAFEGNVSDVKYDIIYGDDAGLVLSVDWDNVTATTGGSLLEDVLQDTESPPTTSSPSSSRTAGATIYNLLEGLRDAVSIWFNVTKDVPCYELTAAPNRRRSKSTAGAVASRGERSRGAGGAPTPPSIAGTEDSMVRRTEGGDASSTKGKEKNATERCSDMMSGGSWPALCCNEGMNLIITEARGLGRDYLWPPSHPRGTRDHADVVAHENDPADPYCEDPDGTYGFPRGRRDPWSTWYDAVYGGLRIGSHSNIVFSNGLLDPWCSAGVYGPGIDPTSTNVTSELRRRGEELVPGLYAQNITSKDDDSMIALVLEYGGHHTDLMYSNDADPPSIAAARKVEKYYIRRWVDEFYSSV